MIKDIALREQAEQLGDITEALSELSVMIKDAFIHQQDRYLEGAERLYLGLNEEIAFDAAMADEVMIGKPLGDREPLICYQNILSRLQMVDKSLIRLAHVLQTQMKEGMLLFDMERERIVMLLECQEDVLRALSGIVRNGDCERLNGLEDECHELVAACLRFAASCESRLAEGLCVLKSAPLLLKIFDRMKTVASNEIEALKLLARWIRDRVAAGMEDRRMGHFSH